MDGIRGGQSMHLGAFLFNLGNHVAAWRHPETPTGGLLDLSFYARLAQTAERGCFDFVFHSDGVGINDTYPEIIGHTVTIRPEPTTLLSALAALTSRIGLAATISTTYHEPYAVARTFATLDHLSGGRVAMNVVTSSTVQEARNHGREAHLDHAARYRRAGEFVDVARGLWDSWEDDAILADQASGRFARSRSRSSSEPSGTILFGSRPVKRATAAARASGADPSGNFGGRDGAGGRHCGPRVHRQHRLGGGAGALRGNKNRGRSHGTTGG